MSSVAQPTRSTFAGLLDLIRNELLVETRAIKNDYRVTHAVQVDERGAALRVLCGAVPVEEIGAYNTYALPSCRECVRIDAQPIRCAKTSPRWLDLELRRLRAEPMLRWFEAQDAAERARAEAEEEERERLKRERHEEQRAWAKSKKELAAKEAARLAAEEEERARLWREEDDNRRAQAALKRNLDAKAVAEVDENRQRREREARQLRQAGYDAKKNAKKDAASLCARHPADATDTQVERADALRRLLAPPDSDAIDAWYRRAVQARDQPRAAPTPARALAPAKHDVALRRNASPEAPPRREPPGPRSADAKGEPPSPSGADMVVRSTDGTTRRVRVLGRDGEFVVHEDLAKPGRLALRHEGTGRKAADFETLAEALAHAMDLNSNGIRPVVERVLAGDEQARRQLGPLLEAHAAHRLERKNATVAPAKPATPSSATPARSPALAAPEPTNAGTPPTVDPAKREETLPGAGRTSSGPGKKCSPASGRSPEPGGRNAGGSSVAPTPGASVRTATGLAERILVLVGNESYMSANKIAQALKAQGSGARIQLVFSEIAAMFGDQRLTRINDVIRPGPRASKLPRAR